jgi:CarD family transcriptional regulator
MQFSVGDNVVHPYYGPGRIASVAQWGVKEETKSYLVIEIPGQGLTVYVPALKANEVGVRPAMSQSSLQQVMRTLRSKPRRLPDDYKARQEQVSAEIRTGHVVQLARVVRDLTWHRERAHLTKIDTDLLKEGWDLLAAEMALVSGVEISDSSKLIGTTVDTAQASPSEETAEPASH